MNSQQYCNTTAAWWLQLGPGVSSTGLCIQGLVTNLWNQREVVEPLQGKAYKKVSPLEYLPLKGYWDPQPPTHLISLPFLAIIGRKGPFCQPLAPWYSVPSRTMIHADAMRPKQGQVSMKWDLWDWEPRQAFPRYTLIASDSGTAMESDNVV